MSEQVKRYTDDGEIIEDLEESPFLPVEVHTPYSPVPALIFLGMMCVTVLGLAWIFTH